MEWNPVQCLESSLLGKFETHRFRSAADVFRSHKGATGNLQISSRLGVRAEVNKQENLAQSPPQRGDATPGKDFLKTPKEHLTSFRTTTRLNHAEEHLNGVFPSGNRKRRMMNVPGYRNAWPFSLSRKHSVGRRDSFGGRKKSCQPPSASTMSRPSSATSA